MAKGSTTGVKPKRKSSAKRTTTTRKKTPAKPRRRTASTTAVDPLEVPEGLSAKATRLWTETVQRYELGAHELLTLEQACRELDLIARMERALDGGMLVVDGSQGQPVESPLVKEIRQHRMTYKSLIAALKLPDEEVPASRATAARAAAQARWGRVGVSGGSA